MIAPADAAVPDKPLSPAADTKTDLRQLRSEVAGFLQTGMPLEDAAALVGIDPAEYQPARPCYVPLPETIKEMCREFREGWSATERRRRWMWPAAGRWTAPIVEIPIVGSREIGGDAAA